MDLGWSGRGGTTRNPYNLRESADGSSSGSAVAVAANLCMAALGTETDGSIIAPASVASVVGVKPTVHNVPLQGIIPFSPSQDSVGPIARTVTDCYKVYKAISLSTQNEDPEPYTADAEKLDLEKIFDTEKAI